MKAYAAIWALLFCLLGCGDGGDSTNQGPNHNTNHPTDTKNSPQAENQAPPEGASAKGVLEVEVIFHGEAKNTIIHDHDGHCGSPIQPDDIVVSNDGELKDVVIYLENVSNKRKSVSKSTLIIDQKGCLFVPHVLLCWPKDEIIIKNSDSSTHNIRINPERNSSLNENVAPSNSATYIPKYSEFIKVVCDIHPWMNAWIVVREHEYYAVTNHKGFVEFREVPSGSYKLTAWHPLLGKLSKDIQVVNSQTTKIKFEYHKH